MSFSSESASSPSSTSTATQQYPTSTVPNRPRPAEISTTGTVPLISHTLPTPYTAKTIQPSNSSTTISAQSSNASPLSVSLERPRILHSRPGTAPPSTDSLESTNSSPISTISTLASSISDPSCTVSPDLPEPFAPLSSNPGFRFARPKFRMDNRRPSNDSGQLSSDMPGHDSSVPSPLALFPASAFISGTAVRSNSDSTISSILSPSMKSLSMEESLAALAASPNRKARNMKRLMINTDGISATAFIDNRLEQQAVMSGRALSEPNLPLMQPISLSQPVSMNTPDRKQASDVPFRRPALNMAPLSLNTSTTSSAPASNTDSPSSFRPKLSIPGLGGKTAARKPFPALAPVASNSSGGIFSPLTGPVGGMSFKRPGGPNLTPLQTPGFAPRGGLSFPPSNVQSGRQPSVSETAATDSGNPSPIVRQTLEHVNTIADEDLPLSREEKTPGYPDGPICIYDEGVWLYHQPTRQEAMEFDVILNVAREVVNPFDETEEEKARRTKYVDVGVQANFFPEAGPVTNSPNPSFEDVTRESGQHSLLDSIPAGKRPEYIHLDWDHNTSVFRSFLDICKLIQDRTQQKKRVLIHCQLGVSRSASLVVAYGIFRDPKLTPDEARARAKDKSQYIDLNMHFMYELGDFRKLLLEQGIQGQGPALAQKAVEDVKRQDISAASPLGAEQRSPLQYLPIMTPIEFKGSSYPFGPTVSSAPPIPTPSVSSVAARQISTAKASPANVQLAKSKFDARPSILSPGPSYGPGSDTPSFKSSFGDVFASLSSSPVHPKLTFPQGQVTRPSNLSSSIAPPVTPLAPEHEAKTEDLGSTIPTMRKVEDEGFVPPASPISPSFNIPWRESDNDDERTETMTKSNSAINLSTAGTKNTNLNLPPEDIPDLGSTTPTTPGRKLRAVPSLPGGFSSMFRQRALFGSSQSLNPSPQVASTTAPPATQTQTPSKPSPSTTSTSTLQTTSSRKSLRPRPSLPTIQSTSLFSPIPPVPPLPQQSDVAVPGLESGLMSPRTEGFVGFFDNSDAAVSNPAPTAATQKAPRAVVDPRSPPVKGDVGVLMGSIDDVL